LNQKVDKSEKWLIKKDKSRIPILKSAVPLMVAGEEMLLEVFLDITERKKAEDALIESEEKYRTFVSKATDGITIAQDEVVKFANPSFARMLGYEAEKMEGIQMTRLIPQEHLPMIMERYKKRLAGEKLPVVYETELLHKNGGKVPVEVSGNLIQYEGRPADLAIIRDITERKEMQEMLAESEEKYRIMVENSNDLIWTLDTEGRLTFVNEEALEIGGYLMSELDKKHFGFGVHPDDLENVKMHVAKTFKGEPQSYEARVFDRHGRIIVLQINAAPLYRNKQVVGTVSFGRDITEHKKAEEALKESEEKFRGLAEQSPNMIFIDQKGRIIYANKKCEEIMGYQRKDLYSEKFDFLDLIAPESKKLVKDSFKKHSKGRDVLSYEYNLLTRNKKELNAIITTKLIAVKGGKAILGIITDITEQVRTREQIKAQALALEQKNIALKELLEQITREKKDITDKVHLNLEKLVIPKIKRLKSKSEDDLKGQLGIIESHIKNIASAFGRRISSRQYALSPREMEICDMIRTGLKNKAIARELRLSLETVETMRKNIRRKLKIQNKEINLKTYLQNL
ncbi:MAG: PAS domain S-box protein, partial [Planctomycetota bacterium]